MNVLLTGVPGVGKTTVVMKLAGLIDRASGFITAEIRVRGRRTGFLIKTLDGREAVLAKRAATGGPRVGPYAVYLDGLDTIAVPAIDAGIQTSCVILIDEIGKMEVKSAAFRAAVTRALESGRDVVATLGVSGGPFMKSVRERPDISLVEVTRENRDGLPARLAELIGGGP